MNKFNQCKYFGKSNHQKHYLCAHSGEEIKPTQCKQCKFFSRKSIEYPILVREVDIKEIAFNEGIHKNESGSLVKIKLSSEQEGCYLGILLGELPHNLSLYYSQSEVLNIIPNYSKVIYLPSFKKIVATNDEEFEIIRTKEDLKGVSQEEIDLYMKSIVPLILSN